MTTLTTHLFKLQVPELFEKALQFGQLVRLERMDRAPDESSFAELNFFVGLVSEERLDLPPDASKADVLAALWAQYLDSESKCEAIAPDAVQEEFASDTEHYVVLKLAATSWRPVSGHVTHLWVREGSDEPVFARFVLEFDWSQFELYRCVAEGIVESLEWAKDTISKADVMVQKDQAWSVFDSMDASRREAIADRYMQLVRPGGAPGLGNSSGDPEPLQAVDLSTLELAALTPEFIDEVLVTTGALERGVLLQTRLLPAAVEVSVDFGDSEDETAVLADVAALASVLHALSESDRKRAGELLWEHCQFCFEVTDYGAGDESNEDFFGIHDSSEAFAEAGKASIYVSGLDEERSGAQFALDFYPPWEDEHGCSLIVRDGVLVAFGTPGDPLPARE